MSFFVPSKHAVKASYAVLVLCLVLASYQEATTTGVSAWLIYLVKLLPVLVFAPAVFNMHVRGLIWFCFILCIYFIDASVDLIAEQTSLLNIGLTLSSFFLFCAILVFIKANANRRKATDRG